MAGIETVFITGVLGQDGAYLAKLALEKGHRVVGGARRSSTQNSWRLRELGVLNDIEIVDFELLEESNIRRAIDKVKPDRLFNLAAQSFVATSFSQPIFTCDVGGLAVLRVLEAIREVNPAIRFYQASTSEMFGKVVETPQTELTPLYPRSPYGVAKVFGHLITRNYREGHGLHASSGILFNHESPLRGVEFVSRKITSTFARIFHHKADVLELGNLDSERDWGHAKDYVRGMWLMTDQPKGDEYVLATGRRASVRDFIRQTAKALDWEIEFEGTGLAEVGRVVSTGKVVVRVNPDYFRPAEVDLLLGNSAKARAVLGWSPETTFEELVTEMISADNSRERR
jgi:GDPmannose 4,6-dehydratase